MSEIGLQIDIGSKNLELFEQNSVKRLSGWDPNEVAWVGVAWGVGLWKSVKGYPSFIYYADEMRPT